MKKKQEEDYLEAFKEYQDKIYLPGYYIGGKLPLYLKAKTKAGGYFLLFTGLITLVLIFTSIISKGFSIESLLGIVTFIYAVFAMIAGIKLIKLNKHKSKSTITK